MSHPGGPPTGRAHGTSSRHQLLQDHRSSPESLLSVAGREAHVQSLLATHPNDHDDNRTGKIYWDVFSILNECSVT